MPVTIAVLGDRNVDFLTHREIDATLALVPADVDAHWLPSPEAESAAEADGLWVAPGTPYRDDGAVLEAIHRARTAGMPILGTCGGFQYMLVEFARSARRRSSTPAWSSRRGRRRRVSRPSSCPAIPSTWRRSSSPRWEARRQVGCTR